MAERTRPPWPGRHRVVMALLLVHIPVLAVWGLRTGWTPSHAVAEVVLPLAALWAVAARATRRRIATGAGAIGLMYSSAVLVHVTEGVTEAHFYFFVAFGLVALYRDWVVFFAAAGFAVGHHVVFALADGQLFAQPYQLEDPLRWAAIHVAFVTVVTAVQAVGMFDVGRSVAARTRLEAEVALGDQRRRTAVALHDDVVQALATARYARELGQHELSDQALDEAMSSSRALVSELLSHGPVDERVLRRPDAALQGS